MSTSRWTRWITIAAVVLLAGIAAIVAYSPMYELALRYGEPQWRATLFPRVRTRGRNSPQRTVGCCPRWLRGTRLVGCGFSLRGLACVFCFIPFPAVLCKPVAAPLPRRDSQIELISTLLVVISTEMITNAIIAPIVIPYSGWPNIAETSQLQSQMTRAMAIAGPMKGRILFQSSSRCFSRWMSDFRFLASYPPAVSIPIRKAMPAGRAPMPMAAIRVPKFSGPVPSSDAANCPDPPEMLEATISPKRQEFAAIWALKMCCRSLRAVAVHFS